MDASGAFLFSGTHARGLPPGAHTRTPHNAYKRCLLMKLLSRVMCLLMAMLLTQPALAETENPVIALVNGEPVYYTEYTAVESAFIYQYQLAGVDLTDPTAYAYVQDLALTYVIEQRLVKQDMQAQGCYNLTAEEEAWCAEQGHLAWEQALAEVGEMMRGTLELPEGTDMTEYALSYAASLGVTEQTYVDEYRTQLAMAKYYSWLVGGAPVTDAEVQLAYDERVARSRALYENDVPAFEQALSSGTEVWYMPAGYRRVLQILLPAHGESDAERLASAQAQVDEINARLEAGESFTSLIAEYGVDVNFSDPTFYSIGYQVHPQSILWEDAFVAAAFSPEMAAPGCWSKPFVSELGVHILYYAEDVPGGAVELNDEVYDMLAYLIYDARTQEALTKRIDVLAEEAEVVIY